MKVLLINCEEAIRLTVCTVLKMNGYDASGALTGQDGLSMAREQQPDWAILITNNILDMPADEVVLRLIEIVPGVKFLFFAGRPQPDFLEVLLQHRLTAELKPLPFGLEEMFQWLGGESALRKFENYPTQAKA